MLLLIPGGGSAFVVSRGGKRPLRLFLKRHALKGQVRAITAQLHLAELRAVTWSTALRGLARTTWRDLFLHCLTSGSAIPSDVPGAPDPEDRRGQLQSQYLELVGRTRS